MRLRLIVTVLLAAAPFAAAPLAAQPRLVRVTLSSGGVAYYEYVTHLDGPGGAALDVPLDQVDDVLASLRIDDPAGSASVSLPGRQPVAEAFRTLPIGQDALASPEALLQALVGAAVKLPGAGLEGSVLSVTPAEAKLADGSVITRHRLALLTPAGLASVVLEEQSEVQLADPALRAQLAAALAAIAGHRTQDRRSLAVALPGPGARDVRLGYVVQAPVWKTSYRITLPADGPARLQGYAVVENLSGQDWHGVALVLTAGQPVLFHQALYEAVFTERPDLPLQSGAAPVPRADEAAEPPPPAPAPAQAMAPVMKLRAPAPPAQPAVSAEQAPTQVEFHITAPVDATAGETVLLPILDRPVPVARVALVSPESGAHPFVALRLTNDAATALPPGLTTLYRDAEALSFVGNAALPPMQPGENRLLSFATDLSTQVIRTDAGDSAVVAVHAARGLVTVDWRDRNTVTYRVGTTPGEPRSLLIEQPVREGWAVTQPAGASRTATRWRIAQDLPAGVVQDIAVVSEHLRHQAVQAASLTPALLAAYAANAALDPATRSAFSRAGTLRAELERQRETLAGLARQIAAVVTDQERLRANLASTTGNQALQKRYTGLLQQQEDGLATLRAQQEAAQAAADRQDAALKDYLAGLAF